MGGLEPLTPSIAKGFQVLISSVVADLVGAMTGLSFNHPETVTLKGLSGTHTVLSVEEDKRQTRT